MGVDVQKLLEAGFDKALATQAPAARAHVARLRRLDPEASPTDIARKVNRTYLSAVTVSGGAAGAGSLVPGVGIPASVADALAFTEATVLYVLSRAEIHGLDPEDIERRRLLTYAVLLGDSANAALGKAIPRAGKHWARQIVEKTPMAAINRANKILGPRFITKYGTKQGVLVLSKQVPLGVGAALGGGGNHLFGRATIKMADKIFGPAPDVWGAAEPVPDEGGSVAHMGGDPSPHVH